jgi:type II secretory ATPase GspE/PulE/Tfp pilus assembly ATPase PilB-like protein
VAFDVNFFKNFELSKTDELVINALLEQRIITQEQIEILFKDQQKVKVNLLEEVIECGFLTKQQFASFLMQNFSVGVTNFRDVSISDELLEKLSYEICLKEGFFPFFEDKEKVCIGLRFFLEEEQIVKIIELLNIRKEIKVFFAKLEDVFNIVQMSFRGEKIEEAVKALNNFNHKKSVKDPIIEFVDTLFEEAFLKKASYVHLEPENNFVRVRFRIEGVLQEICLFYKEVWERVLNRVKMSSSIMGLASINRSYSSVQRLKNSRTGCLSLGFLDNSTLTRR